MDFCPNCGGNSMLRDGAGYSCQDPDCLRYGYVIIPDTTFHLPFLWRYETDKLPIRHDETPFNSSHEKLSRE